MNEKNRFTILILIARPAAGKSELIQYLRSFSSDEWQRRERLWVCVWNKRLHFYGSSIPGENTERSLLQHSILVLTEIHWLSA